LSDEAVLLVDLGNTRLKWAVLRDGRLGQVTAVPHAADGSDAPALTAWEQLAVPLRVLVGSVAGPECDRALTAHSRRLWNLEPRFVRARAEALGVTNGYDSPEKLGVDRWLALLAAHADGRGAACVVDCGTAVTIDVLDDAGRHRGGLIVPGLQLMGECLRTRTRIPPFAMPAARPELGRETGAAIANGALLAVVGAVRETRILAQRILGGTPRLVVAGGAGDAVAAALAEPSERRPDLVLEGLAALARLGDE
jgi:type III pantothenate kinase